MQFVIYWRKISRFYDIYTNAMDTSYEFICRA